MDKIANIFPRFQKVIASIGVYVGFASMAFIFYFLIQETIKFIFVPGTLPPLAPVLPGVEVAGAPTLSFWHWIIAIFIVAAIHEFSHGLVARLHKIPVKSSGFAFLGPILAAFVEPKEKVMEKKTKMQQLSVLAAGPFSNIISAGIILLIIMFLISPFLQTVYIENGIKINEVAEGYPAADLDIETPFIIYSIDDESTLGATEFLEITDELSPGDTVVLGTDQGDYTITTASNPNNESMSYFGMTGIQQEVNLKEEYAHLEKWEPTMEWFQIFIIWLFLISFGIGLFNLLPLGPVDGGRMFYILGVTIFKKESIAKRLLTIVSIFLLILILISLMPWINKLVMGIVNLFF